MADNREFLELREKIDAIDIQKYRKNKLSFPQSREVPEVPKTLN